MQRACCLKYTLIISFHSHCISWHAPFFHFFGFCTDELLRGGWMMQSSHTLCVMEGKAKAVFQSKHVQELLKACEKEKILHRVRWELILLDLSLTLSGSSTVAAVGGSCGTSSWSEMQKKSRFESENFSEPAEENLLLLIPCAWVETAALLFPCPPGRRTIDTYITHINLCNMLKKRESKTKKCLLFYLAVVSTLLGGCGATGRKFLLFVG